MGDQRTTLGWLGIGLMALMALGLGILSGVLLYFAGLSVSNYVQDVPTELWEREGFLVFAGLIVAVAFIPGFSCWKLARRIRHLL